jgi:hypothetical protein
MAGPFFLWMNQVVRRANGGRTSWSVAMKLRSKNGLGGPFSGEEANANACGGHEKGRTGKGPSSGRAKR